MLQWDCIELLVVVVLLNKDVRTKASVCVERVIPDAALIRRRMERQAPETSRTAHQARRADDRQITNVVRDDNIFTDSLCDMADVRNDLSNELVVQIVANDG